MRWDCLELGLRKDSILFEQDLVKEVIILLETFPAWAILVWNFVATWIAKEEFVPNDRCNLRNFVLQMLIAVIET